MNNVDSEPHFDRRAGSEQRIDMWTESEEEIMMVVHQSNSFHPVDV